MLYLPKQTTHKGGFLMKSITQDIKYYQAILSYADQHGLTKAAIKCQSRSLCLYCWTSKGTGREDVPVYGN